MMAIIALGLQKPLCEWGKREVPVSPRMRNSFLRPDRDQYFHGRTRNLMDLAGTHYILYRQLLTIWVTWEKKLVLFSTLFTSPQ